MIEKTTIAQAKQYCLHDKYNISLSGDEKIESDLGIQGFCRYDDSKLYICFFGSNELKDWILNLNFLPKNNYHKGIAKGYLSVRQSIWNQAFGLDLKNPNFRAKVKNLATSRFYSNTPVVCCGHSLGGAIALFAASELANFGFEVQLITFGQPKILAKIPKSNRIKNYVRVANPFDLITHVPCWFKHLPGQTKYKIWWGNPHDLRKY